MPVRRYCGSMHVNDSGRVVEHVWLALAEQFPHVALDEYIVMPNHFHGIICIAAPGLDSKSETKGGENRGAATKGAASSAPTEPTIGKIMRAFKSISASMSIGCRIGRGCHCGSAIITSGSSEMTRNWQPSVITSSPIRPTGRRMKNIHRRGAACCALVLYAACCALPW